MEQAREARAPEPAQEQAEAAAAAEIADQGRVQDLQETVYVLRAALWLLINAAFPATTWNAQNAAQK